MAFKFPSKITINANGWKLLGFLATVAMLSYAFYYDTNSTLEDNTKSIEKIEKDIDEMSDIVIDNSIFKGVTRNDLKSIKKRIERIDEKQDKMIEMLTNLTLDK